MGERRACVHTKNRVRAREDLRLQGQHLAWPPGAQAGCAAGLTSDIAARTMPSIRRDVVEARATREAETSPRRQRCRGASIERSSRPPFSSAASHGAKGGRVSTGIAARASDKKRRGRRAITVRRCRALRSRPQHVA